MHTKEIEIKNYGPHKETKIEFQLITTIIGNEEQPNDIGKTWVIKALKLVLFNEDWPFDDVRRGASEGSIKVTLANGTSIVRTRTKSKQNVKIIYTDGSEETFDGITAVAPLLTKIIGLKPLVLDDPKKPENVNFIPVGAGPIIEGRADTLQKKILATLGMTKIDSARRLLNSNIKGTEAELSQLNDLQNKLVPVLELEPSISNLALFSGAISSEIEELNILEEKLQELELINNPTPILDKTTVNLLDEGLVKVKSYLEDLEKEIQHYSEITKLDIERSIITEAIETQLLKLKEVEEELVSLLKETKICKECGSVIA